MRIKNFIENLILSALIFNYCNAKGGRRGGGGGSRGGGSKTSNTKHTSSSSTNIGTKNHIITKNRTL